MTTAAERLATFSSGLSDEQIPVTVQSAGKLHLLDTLGCGLAAHALDTAPAAREAMRELDGSGPATAIGVETGMSASAAALVNGSTCHALDFDDTHPGAVAHVSVAVAPAAMATAEALGIAGSLAAGLLEFLADGSSTKRLHPGFAAQSGVIAAALAAHGATGPATVLEGRFGVYRAFLGRDDIDVEPLLGDLGSHWETPLIAFKPYPACHYVHAALDATVAAVTETGLTSDEIDEIVLISPPAGVAMVLEPAAAKARPRSEYEAKFSLPYSVASYLLRGPVDVATYTDEAIADETVLALAARIRYEVKDFDTAGRAFPGGVRIRTADGRSIERELRFQRGDPENPMSTQEVLDKFAANASLALGDDDRQELADAVMGIERESDLSALRLLARASRRVAA